MPPPPSLAGSEVDQFRTQGPGTTVTDRDDDDLPFLEFVHCQLCHRRYPEREDLEFWMTECGHILCDDDEHDHQPDQCTFCGKQKVEITAIGERDKIPASLQRWFRSPAKSIKRVEEELSALRFSIPTLIRQNRHYAAQLEAYKKSGAVPIPTTRTMAAQERETAELRRLRQQVEVLAAKIDSGNQPRSNNPPAPAQEYQQNTLPQVSPALGQYDNIAPQQGSYAQLQGPTPQQQYLPQPSQSQYVPQSQLQYLPQPLSSQHQQQSLPQPQYQQQSLPQPQYQPQTPSHPSMRYQLPTPHPAQGPPKLPPAPRSYRPDPPPRQSQPIGETYANPRRAHLPGPQPTLPGSIPYQSHENDRKSRRMEGTERFVPSRGIDQEAEGPAYTPNPVSYQTPSRYTLKPQNIRPQTAPRNNLRWALDGNCRRTNGEVSKFLYDAGKESSSTPRPEIPFSERLKVSGVGEQGHIPRRAASAGGTSSQLPWDRVYDAGPSRLRDVARDE
ncbi:hypothetical protein P7C73_g238, partial [Tremellales sp. Uapishka_1]